MRAVVQRVQRASVTVESEICGRIDGGLLAFVGVAKGDGDPDVQYIATKIRELRVFPDRDGRMNRSVADVRGQVMVISQFTLQADCRSGRRPSFDGAAPADTAILLFNAVVEALRQHGLRVSTGVFQAQMQVELVNDGPVTVLLDSRRLF